MGKVDESHDAEHQREPHADERVDPSRAAARRRGSGRGLSDQRRGSGIMVGLPVDRFSGNTVTSFPPCHCIIVVRARTFVPSSLNFMPQPFTSELSGRSSLRAAARSLSGSRLPARGDDVLHERPRTDEADVRVRRRLAVLPLHEARAELLVEGACLGREPVHVDGAR